MRIHNLYTDANGESHFRDIEVEWIETRRGSKLSKRLPATGVIFRETAAEHNVDWHPAPRRQYTVNLDARVKIPASDGEAGVIAGHAAIRSCAERFAAQRAGGTQFRHMITNIATDIEPGGDRARATAYLLVLITRDGQSRRLPPGRYECEAVKEAGVWRFCR